MYYMYELFTRFAVPVLIGLMILCAAFVLLREGFVLRRKAICLDNYPRYLRLYRLKPIKPLIGLYIVIGGVCLVCLVMDIVSPINHVQIIPDAILIVMAAGLIYFEFHIGYQNKNLDSFNALRRKILAADAEAGDIRTLIANNEREKETIKARCHRMAEQFHERSGIWIFKSDVDKLFDDVEGFISHAKEASVNYRSALRKTFNEALDAYLIQDKELDPQQDLAKSIIITDEEFKSRFALIEQAMEELLNDAFAKAFDDAAFKDETAFFDAMGMLKDADAALQGKEEQLLRQIGCFPKKDKSIDLLQSRGLLTVEWSKAIGGITSENWWFIAAIFHKGEEKEKRAIVLDAVKNDDADLVYRLSDTSLTLSPATLEAIDALGLDNHACRCLRALQTISSQHQVYQSKAKILESMWAVLDQRDEVLQGIAHSGYFLENKDRIEQAYAAAKKEAYSVIALAKKVVVEFQLSYVGRPYSVDKNKVIQLYNEYAFWLDKSGLASLSLLLVAMLRESNQNYATAVSLARRFHVVEGGSEKEFVANLKKYVCNTNLIKTKRIVNRIESKRCLLDDILTM